MSRKTEVQEMSFLLYTAKSNIDELNFLLANGWRVKFPPVGVASGGVGKGFSEIKAIMTGAWLLILYKDEADAVDNLSTGEGI